jgi:hypothetical protein
LLFVFSVILSDTRRTPRILHDVYGAKLAYDQVRLRLHPGQQL